MIKTGEETSAEKGTAGKDGSVQQTLTVRIQLNEFVIPPVTDALVIGRKAPIGSEALQKALCLLHVSPFEQIDFPDDDTVEVLLVRRSVLRKLPHDRLVALVLRRVKPYMTNDEVVHLKMGRSFLMSRRYGKAGNPTHSCTGSLPQSVDGSRFRIATATRTAQAIRNLQTHCDKLRLPMGCPSGTVNQRTVIDCQRLARQTMLSMRWASPIVGHRSCTS